MSCNYAEGLSHYEHKGKLGLPELFDDAKAVEKHVRQLAKLMKKSKHTVFHTGAGISTSAGIPDFRGPKGVWTLEKEGLKPDVNISWDDATPTSTHMALVALQKCGYAQYVVTQNIDGLHLRSGFPRRYMAELHGNMFIDRCNHCKREYIRPMAVTTVGQKSIGISCPVKRRNGHSCRGKLHDTVLDWEDGLPDDELTLAQLHSNAADLSVCLGTTLQIVPSGNLPVLTKKQGGHLVICNLQPTKQDRNADFIIHTYVDRVMKRLLELLKVAPVEYSRENDPVLISRLKVEEEHLEVGNGMSHLPLAPLDWSIPQEWLDDEVLAERSRKRNGNKNVEMERIERYKRRLAETDGEVKKVNVKRKWANGILDTDIARKRVRTLKPKRKRKPRKNRDHLGDINGETNGKRRQHSLRETRQSVNLKRIKLEEEVIKDEVENGHGLLTAKIDVLMKIEIKEEDSLPNESVSQRANKSEIKKSLLSLDKDQTKEKFVNFFIDMYTDIKVADIVTETDIKVEAIVRQVDIIKEECSDIKEESTQDTNERKCSADDESYSRDVKRNGLTTAINVNKELTNRDAEHSELFITYAENIQEVSCVNSIISESSTQVFLTDTGNAVEEFVSCTGDMQEIQSASVLHDNKNSCLDTVKLHVLPEISEVLSSLSPSENRENVLASHVVTEDVILTPEIKKNVLSSPPEITMIVPASHDNDMTKNTPIPLKITENESVFSETEHIRLTHLDSAENVLVYPDSVNNKLMAPEIQKNEHVLLFPDVAKIVQGFTETTRKVLGSSENNEIVPFPPAGIVNHVKLPAIDTNNAQISHGITNDVLAFPDSFSESVSLCTEITETASATLNDINEYVPVSREIAEIEMVCSDSILTSVPLPLEVTKTVTSFLDESITKSSPILNPIPENELVSPDVTAVIKTAFIPSKITENILVSIADFETPNEKLIKDVINADAITDLEN